MKYSIGIYFFVFFIPFIPINSVAQGEDGVVLRDESKWYEGHVRLLDGNELTGLVKFNDNTGVVSFDDDNSIGFFTSNNLVTFGFYDEILDRDRVFHSLLYEDTDAGRKSYPFSK